MALVLGAQAFAFQILDNSGDPAGGAKVWHYSGGSSSNVLPMWSDEDKTTPVANPIVADGNGRIKAYGDGVYHIIIKDTSEVTTFLDHDHWMISSAYNDPKDNDGAGGFESVEGQNQGASVPSPTANGLGHVFYKIVSGQVRGAYINHDGSEYFAMAEWNSTGGREFDDMITKLPIVDIRHTDYGAATGNSTNKTEIQAAIDALTSTGGTVLAPQGTWKVDGLTYQDNVDIVGVGRATVLQMPASPSTAFMLKATDNTGIGLKNLVLDGIDDGSSNSLVELLRSAGTTTNVTIQNVDFINQAATETSIKIVGVSGSECTNIVIDNCRFEDVEKAITADFMDKSWITNCTFKTIGDEPIFLDSSDKNHITDNTCESWEASSDAIHLTDSSNNIIVDNTLVGTESNSITTDGTSDLNNIRGNDVSGGHANDITVVGTSTIVQNNVGSAVSQNGQGGASGTAVSTAWDFVSFSSTAEDSGGGTDGILKDTIVADRLSNNLLASEDAGTALYSHVLMSGLTGYGSSFLNVFSIQSDDTVLLSMSDAQDVLSAFVDVPAAEPYSVYDNLTDTLTWEASPIETVNLVSSSGEVSDTVAINAEEDLLKIEIFDNTSTSTPVGDISVAYGDTTKNKIVNDFTFPGDTSQIGTHFMKKVSGQNTMTLYLLRNTGTCDINLKVFRLKRDIDA